jgi:hypothetical protein
MASTPNDNYSFEMLGGQADWVFLRTLLPAVLALFVADEYEAVYVGSGFTVDTVGTFVTARHVAAELRDQEDRTYHAARPSALLMQPTGGGLVPITSLNMSPDSNITSDLASGLLDVSKLNIEGSVPFFKLSRDPVEVGQDVVAVGHAYIPGQTFATDCAVSRGLFTVTGGLAMLHEPVVETYEKWTNLPAPLFRLDCQMPGGMSGGPIIREDTREVIGVCAYGLGLGAENHKPYCYGSMLRPLWEPYGLGDDKWLP